VPRVDQSFDQGVSIPVGGNRFREQRKVFGTRVIDFKVSRLDTNGDLFGSHGMEMTGPPSPVE
jgi:hypothetical protein